MYKIILHKQPSKYYSKCPDSIARRINKSLSRLQENPYCLGTKNLGGKLGDFMTIRAGGIRIVYRVFKDEKIVRVIAILPRGDVYKKIS